MSSLRQWPYPNLDEEKPQHPFGLEVPQLKDIKRLAASTATTSSSASKSKQELGLRTGFSEKEREVSQQAIRRQMELENELLKQQQQQQDQSAEYDDDEDVQDGGVTTAVSTYNHRCDPRPSKWIDAFHLKSLEYPYNKIGMVLHLWEAKGTFLTKFYKTGYDLWIKSSWLSTSNDPLITELVEIMDCENILQAGIELGVYFDHISGLCSNFDLGLWPSEAFYWPYYITDINRLVQ